jgi:hypothetical protein
MNQYHVTAETDMSEEYSGTVTQEFERPDPPRIDSVLIKVLERGKRMPKMFPVNKLEAVRYWQTMQDPPKQETEHVEWQSNPKHKDGGFWRSPYIDRLAFTLKKFLSMDSPRQFFIIENIEKGCSWRGDGITFYKRVIEETARMKTMGKDEYIKEAKRAASRYGVNI